MGDSSTVTSKPLHRIGTAAYEWSGSGQWIWDPDICDKLSVVKKYQVQKVHVSMYGVRCHRLLSPLRASAAGLLGTRSITLHNDILCPVHTFVFTLIQILSFVIYYVSWFSVDIAKLSRIWYLGRQVALESHALEHNTTTSSSHCKLTKSPPSTSSCAPVT